MSQPASLTRGALLPALLLALLGLSGCAARSARPQAGGEDEVDRVALAALLLKDGHFARAGAVLDEVDPGAEGVDAQRWHTLRGLVALHGQDPARARDELQAASALGPVEPMTWVYLAQAHAGLQAWAEALDDLRRAGAAWEGMSGIHRLRAHCAWQMGDHVEAFAALGAAERRFPAEEGFTRQRLLYLLELRLVREAAHDGREWLTRTGWPLETCLTVGEALRRARAPEESAAVLEVARLVHPGHEKLLLSLAHAHLDAGRPRAAAVALEEAALTRPGLLVEAAELRRRAGDLERALYLNAEVSDQAQKTRQRLSILLQAGRLEQAAALAPRVSRLGLLADEEVRYALAWVHFRTGDLERAEEALRGITRPDLFRAATDLRRAIDVSREEER